MSLHEIFSKGVRAFFLFAALPLIFAAKRPAFAIQVAERPFRPQIEVAAARTTIPTGQELDLLPYETPLQDFERSPFQSWPLSISFAGPPGHFLVAFKNRINLMPESFDGILKRFPISADSICLSPGASMAAATVAAKKGLRELHWSGDGESESRLLIRPSGPGCDWSPGGGEFVYSCADPLNPENRGICRYVTATGTPRAITPEGKAAYPSYSPDGAWVAYEDDGRIFLVDVNGKQDPNEITRGLPGKFSRPTWSPDGSKIGFNRKEPFRAAFVYRRADGGVRRIGAPGVPASSPRWSADGRWLAYSDFERIVILDADTLTEKARGAYEIANTLVSWDPAGPRLLYSARINGVLDAVIMTLSESGDADRAAADGKGK